MGIGGDSLSPSEHCDVSSALMNSDQHSTNSPVQTGCAYYIEAPCEDIRYLGTSISMFATALLRSSA